MRICITSSANADAALNTNVWWVTNVSSTWKTSKAREVLWSRILTGYHMITWKFWSFCIEDDWLKVIKIDLFIDKPYDDFKAKL